MAYTSKKKSGTDNKKTGTSNKKIKNRGRLTKKQKRLVKTIVNNPQMTNRDAYRQVYNTTTENNATVDTEVSRTLSKPQVRTELERYTNLVENTLVNTVVDYRDSDNITERKLAVDTSKFLYEHIRGKATQRIEQNTNKLAITLDLTGVAPQENTDIIEE